MNTNLVVVYWLIYMKTSIVRYSCTHPSDGAEMQPMIYS